MSGSWRATFHVPVSDVAAGADAVGADAAGMSAFAGADASLTRLATQSPMTWPSPLMLPLIESPATVPVISIAIVPFCPGKSNQTETFASFCSASTLACPMSDAIVPTILSAFLVSFRVEGMGPWAVLTVTLHVPMASGAAAGV